jgi:hypothetical protein
MGQENGLPLNETTVAEHLSSLNYSCHAIGKVRTLSSRIRQCGIAHCQLDSCDYIADWMVCAVARGVRKSEHDPSATWV